MENFKELIEADIKEYQQNKRFVTNIDKDEWAFNYWVLDKLFYEDEEIIESKIIDYHDLGVDAFEIYEDAKDIYLIQNKYYSENTKITSEYIKNDFLLRPINALKNNTYSKSKELQDAYNKYRNDPDLTIYLQLYVTNNNHNVDADNYVKEFNLKNHNCRAQIFYLDDIQEKYYGERKEIRKNLTVTIGSINKGTVLNINNSAYKLANVIDAKYIFTPVTEIYKIYTKAMKEGYPIFDKNIREYLGNRGVNKNIYNTLMDPIDRKNFFYYNNGITIICDKVKNSDLSFPAQNIGVTYDVINPQIVNGCQTVNSIYEVLKNVNPNELLEQYKDTYVMLKILEIDANDETQKQLYKNIVKYNNSQNAIDEKTFAANANTFQRLQEEFEEKGFLLLIKQSDKNKFSNKYKSVTTLKSKNHSRLEKFGLPETNKASDVFIPLEKLLQVINAFVDGGYTAYTKKSNMLKFNSAQYNNAVKFILSANSNDLLLDLYLLYKKADVVKNEKADNRAPIPYYLIDCFAKYECKERSYKYILQELSTKEKIDRLIRLYTAVTKAYTNTYNKTTGVDYNKMIKQAINYEMLDNQRDNLLDLF